MPDYSDEEQKRFGEAIARPSIRKIYSQDAFEALQRAGVNVDRVPPELIDLFADLSPEELDIVGRVAQRALENPALAVQGDHVGVIIH